MKIGTQPIEIDIDVKMIDKKLFALSDIFSVSNDRAKELTQIVLKISSNASNAIELIKKIGLLEIRFEERLLLIHTALETICHTGIINFKKED